jgi:hypothetical protein
MELSFVRVLGFYVIFAGATGIPTSIQLMDGDSTMDCNSVIPAFTCAFVGTVIGGFHERRLPLPGTLCIDIALTSAFRIAARTDFGWGRTMYRDAVSATIARLLPSTVFTPH